MLEIKNLVVNYGAITALHGISLSAPDGKIVTLIGANGAGKTTTLKTISGLLKPRGGEILYETIKNIAGLPPHQIVARGISQSPEGRMRFLPTSPSSKICNSALICKKIGTPSAANSTASSFYFHA